MNFKLGKGLIVYLCYGYAYVGSKKGDESAGLIPRKPQGPVAKMSTGGKAPVYIKPKVAPCSPPSDFDENVDGKIFSDA